MKNLLIITFFLLSLAACQYSPQDMAIDLSGEWQFKIDLDDQGIDQQWFADNFPEAITLPGSMKENDKGFIPTLETEWTGSIYDSSWFFNPHTEPYRQPGNLMFPFWLTPKLYYKGPAWYQKQVNIPENWDGKRIILHLERPHWETTVWVNGDEAGMQNSLSVPHEYDITDYLATGNNTIAIRVDNRVKDIRIGPDSHSITDHTQGNWNGIVGDIKLMAEPRVFIEDVEVWPDVEGKKARVVVSFVNETGEPVTGIVHLNAEAFNTEKRHNPSSIKKEFSIGKNGGDVELVYDLGNDVQLWDEFNPALYKLVAKAALDSGNDTYETTFGMRSFKTDGTQFTINGRPVYLRGTLECAVHPITGYAPMRKERWKEIFENAQSYGVNHIRFHSWCPPKAAFEVADELGIYLQPEGPFWTNHGTAVGYDEPVDQYIKEECDRILDEYGNHPSFVMFAYGNEPAGRHQIEFLNGLVDYWMAEDDRRLYTHASIGGSWPLAPSNEFIVRAESRGLPWGKRPQSEFDYAEKIAPYDVPYVAHEMGQFCVFPDFDEISKYTGVYEARNFEMFKAELERKNMGDQARDFFMASGEFQAICYKNEIEASLRTPENGGTQLLGLSDFSGQGSAIVGVVDAFWDEKDYVSPEEFSRFFSPTVPLARFHKFVYTSADTLKVQAEVTHYGKNTLKQVSPEWTITNDAGETVGEGTMQAQSVRFGNFKFEEIILPLDFVSHAAKFNLELTVDGHQNDWDFWVYPDELPQIPEEDVVIAQDFNQEVAEALDEGKKVLLLGAGKVERGKDVIQYFRPVFWNTSWFQMRPPHTLGILTKPEHPALADFPTEFHSNLQWWEILHQQQVMNLDHFPADFKPLVQPIDTWFLNRKLGLIFEANVSNGKLMVCSADLESDMDNRIVARQMRYSLLKYMNSTEFKPEFTVTKDHIFDIFTEGEIEGVDFHTSDSPDDLIP